MKRKAVWWDTYCDSRHFRVHCKTRGAACHQTLKHLKQSKGILKSDRHGFKSVIAKVSEDQRD